MFPPKFAFYSSTPQQGKSTACEILERRYFCQRLSFAAPLKDMLRILLEHCLLSEEEVEHYFHQSKEDAIPLLHKSYRYLARTLGTEWGREAVSSTMWVDIMENKIKSYSKWPGGICIDDMRFQNELEMLQQNGFKIIQVICDVDRGPNQDQHASDTALRGFADFDHVIHNNGGLLDLRKQLELLVEG
jgi:hypothetical protein